MNSITTVEEQQSFTEEEAIRAQIKRSATLRKDIFWGVFAALWVFGITAGIVIGILYETMRS